MSELEMVGTSSTMVTVMVPESALPSTSVTVTARSWETCVSVAPVLCSRVLSFSV